MTPEEPLPETTPPEPASELLRVLDAYLADLRAGKAPDRAALLLLAVLDAGLAGTEYRAWADGSAKVHVRRYRLATEIHCFPRTKSTTQHPRACSPPERHWARMPSLVQ